MTADTLDLLRASFNRRLRAEGKAERTLVLYGQSITYFSQWLAQEGLRADLDSLTRDNVLAWLEALRAPADRRDDQHPVEGVYSHN
jgi:site-specific recombinase XerD